MHRQFSLQPFSRHYSHSTNPFLDFLEIEPGVEERSSFTASGAGSKGSQICVTLDKRETLLEVLTVYKAVHAAGTLHTLTFVTVNDYLWLLRAVSQELSVMKRKAMYYLAAAVSDFFLPRQKMASNPSITFSTLMRYASEFCSQSTKSSQARALCTLRWTKCQKF